MADSRESRPLFIVGASTRSAAYSAIRAGFRPECGDLFADRDLRAIADVWPLQDYPEDIPAVSSAASPGPFLYTGALENHPFLLGELAASRPLWGNGPETLALVRNPIWLADILKAEQLPVLEVRDASDPPPANGRWLRKPLCSAGGRRIESYRKPVRHEDEPHYFQQKGSGVACSAVFLAGPRNTWLLGITRQLVGVPMLAAAEFAYCGSWGPLEENSRRTQLLRRLGSVVAEAGRMRGLFGVDFLWDGRSVWLTEVNPRYTASVEILEHVWKISLLDWHARACLACDDPGEADQLEEELQTFTHSPRDKRPSFIVGKAILYAREKLATGRLGHVPTAERLSGNLDSNARCGRKDPRSTGYFVHTQNFWTVSETDWRIPDLADLPAEKSILPAGSPICTVFATGRHVRQCLLRLARKVPRVISALGETRCS